MTATDQDVTRAETLYGVYRAHLDTCPRRHIGILADCTEGARLLSAVHAARLATGRRQ
ncbi:hypothetical protein ABT390_35520 [Streptomyces aurantiacus]|uniref:Uncharacterized protein n=1 Tax=Streptomyces aurantiacus JA 4570 TaxID=1286094 RepID=S4A3Q8_9ACTN|nr:hypothetical protein [Streptomyces aurantiacus]EPH45350.1 hypothetical protein STRAU_1615 [Streptomyces aurantiacus JA 4570]